MHKKYCLVVTDDYSMFTWVFFLATKDETSEILKNFINEVENLVDKKVKILRSDNRTEFKNKVMDDFCREKGIRREYSVARTPQQNVVAERRNRTLVEAARTMVLVVKPHNKTPYELFRGFKPALSFMRPFGCHVTILNTLDNLGKFDGKSDKGFFVGYSLHIGFLENNPMVEGNGPKWLFDIDSLTQSMNYVPVTAGTTTNESAGTQGDLNEGTITGNDGTIQDGIVMPIWKDASYFDTPSIKVSHDELESSSAAEKRNVEKRNDEGISKASTDDAQDRPESSSPNINTVGPSVNTANAIPRTGNLNINTLSPTVITTRSPRPQSVLGIFSLRDYVSPEASNADLIGDDTELDMSNLNVSYQVPTTPTTRIHKDHSLDQVIGDIQSREEQKRVSKALSDSSWVEAMQEELLQFKLQKIEEEVYVSQPPGFEDPDHPDKVYKVVKAMYGLHQAPRAWYETLANYLVGNGFQRGKIDQTLYLKDKPTLGLWYPRDSPFKLVAYSDSDYAGATQDRKSTTGGCQFLGNRLISWQCKKQTVVATSTTKAEYVDAASCRGQVLWIQNQLLDYGYNFMNTMIHIDNNSTICIIENPVQHSKTKHIEIRHHFIRDCNAKKLIQMVKIDTENNVAYLLTKGFDAGRFQYLVSSIGMLNP
ncbi:putative ribonuclease H-like domain-containing protein [Tanacetum coccineum]